MDEGPPSGKTLAQWHYHILHLILQVLQIKSYSNDSRQQSAAIQVYFDLTEGTRDISLCFLRMPSYYSKTVA